MREETTGTLQTIPDLNYYPPRWAPFGLDQVHPLQQTAGHEGLQEQVLALVISLFPFKSATTNTNFGQGASSPRLQRTDGFLCPFHPDGRDVDLRLSGSYKKEEDQHDVQHGSI